jgi:Flp pilus assembly protein TadD
LAGQEPALEEALVRAGLWGVATQEDGWPLDALRAGRFRARGDTAAARRALDRALEIAPWSPQARNDAAALALEQGRLTHAMAHTAAGLRAAPGRVDLRINRAIAWHELGHPAETLRTLSGVDSAACTPREWALVRALRTACSAESR